MLVGDFLLGQAFRMMVEVGSLRALDILSAAATVIAEGEVMQLAPPRTGDQRGGLPRGDPGQDRRTLRRRLRGRAGDRRAQRGRAGGRAAYGMNLGIAFQLIDDALDYGGTSTELGKNVGDDFREGKITLPIVLAYRRGSEEDRAFWRRTLTRGEIRDDDLATALRPCAVTAPWKRRSPAPAITARRPRRRSRSSRGAGAVRAPRRGGILRGAGALTPVCAVGTGTASFALTDGMKGFRPSRIIHTEMPCEVVRHPHPPARRHRQRAGADPRDP